MIKKIGRFILNELDLSLLMGISKQKHIIPLYHTVSNKKLPHIENLYRVKDVEGFKCDLDFFLKYYKSVNVDDLITHLRENKKKETVFHLTFDDGLKEIVTIIAPILLEKGIHATFFVNPDFINNTSLFYRFKVSLLVNKIKSKSISKNTLKVLITLLNEEKGETVTHKLLNVSYNNKGILDEVSEILEVDFNEFLRTEPFVNDKDIKWLIEKGFTIGAHSLDHPLYRNISLEEQIYQTEKSISILNEKYSLNNRFFAFPFNDIGVLNEFFKAINSQKSTFSFGTSGFGSDLLYLNFQRVAMENSTLRVDELVKVHHVKFLLQFYK